MNKSTISVLYVLAMIAIVIIVDVVFFRTQFKPRLIANIVIVAVFILVYLVFL